MGFCKNDFYLYLYLQLVIILFLTLIVIKNSYSIYFFILIVACNAQESIIMKLLKEKMQNYFFVSEKYCSSTFLEQIMHGITIFKWIIDIVSED